MMAKRYVVIPCEEPYVRHRWKWVMGQYADADHPYEEEVCKRCFVYRGEIYNYDSYPEFKIDIENLETTDRQVFLGENV